MDNPRDSGLLARHGAVWLTMLGMAVGGISWVLGLAGQVDNQREQIVALQAEVANRRGAMNLIEGVQRDVARLERAQERIVEELEVREVYKETLVRLSEHLRTVDERLQQLERAAGRRSEHEAPTERPR